MHAQSQMSEFLLQNNSFLLYITNYNSQEVLQLNTFQNRDNEKNSNSIINDIAYTVYRRQNKAGARSKLDVALYV